MLLEKVGLPIRAQTTVTAMGIASCKDGRATLLALSWGKIQRYRVSLDSHVSQLGL